MKKLLTLVLFLITILAFVLAVGYYYFELRPVAVVLLKTDIQPLLAIRGEILALDYEISKIPFALLKDATPDKIKGGWNESNIYIVLKKENSKYWTAQAAYKKPPRKQEKFFLWGRCNSKLYETFYIRYNIESVTINQAIAKAIKKQIQDILQDNSTPIVIDAQVAINWQGKARLRRIIVNEKSYGI